MTKVTIHELRGGNLDLDLLPNPQVNWPQERCPWNVAEGVNTHRCAVKNVSMCEHFQGIKAPDVVLCSYPENKFN